MGDDDSHDQLYPLSDVAVLGADPWLETRLDHPEDAVVAADGTVYAGGEDGQLYRIDPDDDSAEELANTGGFVLGVALGPEGDLYVCDFQEHAVVRLPLEAGVPAGDLETVTSGSHDERPRHPNYCVFGPDGRLYVSDSGDRSDMAASGGCIYVVDPDGTERVLTTEPSAFPNGLALSDDGQRLYVAETGSHSVTAVEITDGDVAAVRHVTDEFGLVDGLALDDDGRLYAASIGDNAIYRLADPEAPPEEHRVECVVRDPDGLTIGNPTNVTFGGPDNSRLYIANLGLWHLSTLDLDGRQG
jgi:sugar lactone lactonase YvrE